MTLILPVKGNFYSLWGNPIKDISQTWDSCLQSTGENLLFHHQCASEHIPQTSRCWIFSLSRNRVIWFWPLLGSHSWPTSTDHLPQFGQLTSALLLSGQLSLSLPIACFCCCDYCLLFSETRPFLALINTLWSWSQSLNNHEDLLHANGLYIFTGSMPRYRIPW